MTAPRRVRARSKARAGYLAIGAVLATFACAAAPGRSSAAPEQTQIPVVPPTSASASPSATSPAAGLPRSPDPSPIPASSLTGDLPRDCPAGITTAVDAMLIPSFHGFDSPLAAAQHVNDSAFADFAFPRAPVSVKEGGSVSAGDPRSRSIVVTTGAGSSILYKVQQQRDGSWVVFRATRTCAAGTTSPTEKPESARPVVPCVRGEVAAAPTVGAGFPSPVDAVKGWWDEGHSQPPGSYLDPHPVARHTHEQTVSVISSSASAVTATYVVRQFADDSWHVVHASVRVCEAS